MIAARDAAELGPAAHGGAHGGSLRRAACVGLTTFASTLALAVALQALFASTPAACGAACASALASSGVAVVLGIPALAWAAALHAVLLCVAWSAAVAQARGARLASELRSVQLALVALLLAGSATYLVLGLATGVRCPVCLTLHALAVLAALGVALLPRASAPPGTRTRRLALAGLALGVWLLGAWGLARAEIRVKDARLVPAASTDKWLAAICQPTACPAAAHFGPEVLPEEDASIVLGQAPDATSPTLVAWLDLECPACRADFKAEAPLFRDRLARGQATRLVLRGGACEPGGHGGARSCEAPAAVICAARHAGPEAALDHLAWELSAEPGFYTIDDRRRALSALSPLAARCLDSELALGPRGTLSLHARAARRLAASAERHGGCDAGDPAPWWCFAATPSFAIVHPTPPRNTAGDAFASATGDLRREVLEQCLETSP